MQWHPPVLVIAVRDEWWEDWKFGTYPIHSGISSVFYLPHNRTLGTRCHKYYNHPWVNTAKKTKNMRASESICLPTVVGKLNIKFDNFQQLTFLSDFQFQTSGHLIPTNLVEIIRLIDFNKPLILHFPRWSKHGIWSDRPLQSLI